jgi:hypothetical protein
MMPNLSANRECLYASALGNRKLTSGKWAFGLDPLVPAIIWAKTKGPATSLQIRPPVREPLVPVRYEPLVPIWDTNRDQRAMRCAARMCAPFSPGLCLKPRLKASAYIYGHSPSLIFLVFFLDGGVWAYASSPFHFYALEVFVEMCVRAMPLQFTKHNYGMRCPSHA